MVVFLIARLKHVYAMSGEAHQIYEDLCYFSDDCHPGFHNTEDDAEPLDWEGRAAQSPELPRTQQGKAHGVMVGNE